MIYKFNNKYNTKILVYNLSNYNFLLKKLELSEKDFKKYKLLIPKRKKEFIGVRLALKNFGLSFNDIYYNKYGKPIIINKKFYISFSHSYDKIAVAISRFPVGIDIELIRSKILNIKKKILRKDEIDFLEKTQEIVQLHIIWGIKESLYKIHNYKLTNYLNKCKIEPFSINDKKIKSWIIEGLYSKSFLAFQCKIKNYQLVYVIDYK